MGKELTIEEFYYTLCFSVYMFEGDFMLNSTTDGLAYSLELGSNLLYFIKPDIRHTRKATEMY